MVGTLVGRISSRLPGQLARIGQLNIRRPEELNPSIDCECYLTPEIRLQRILARCLTELAKKLANGARNRSREMRRLAVELGRQ